MGDQERSGTNDDSQPADQRSVARPARPEAARGRETEIAVLGVGMHPWGKWGRNFVEYGVVAARAARASSTVATKNVLQPAAASARTTGSVPQP